MATSPRPPVGILGPSGKPLRSVFDDGQALPHALTFNATIEGGYHTYFHGPSDEAVRFARQYALDMLRDPFMWGLFEERVLAVSSLKWSLKVPDERNPLQVAVKDHLKKALDQTPGWTDRVKWLMRSRWYGRYGTQETWKWRSIDGKRTLVSEQCEPVNGDKIIFKFSGLPAILANASATLPNAEYITAANDGGPAMLLKGTWRNKFILALWNRQDEDYYNAEQADAIWGRGLRSICFWNWWLRQEYRSWISDFLQRVGLGITLWTYAAGNPESELAVRNAMTTQSERVNIALPVFMNSNGNCAEGIKRIEVPMEGADILLKIVEPLEQQIERVIVGQEGSAKATSGGGIGNEASTEFRMQTKQQITLDDAKGIGEALTGRYNWPGLISTMQFATFPETMLDKPGGFQVRLEFEVEKVGPEKSLDAIEKAAKMVAVRADDVRQAAGLAKPAEGDELAKGQEEKPQGMPGKPGELTQNPHQPERLGEGPETVDEAEFANAPDHLQRDDAPARYEAGEDSGGHWITIGADDWGDGERHGGTHVFIDGAGVIKKGPGNLVNHNVRNLKGGKPQKDVAPEGKYKRPHELTHSEYEGNVMEAAAHLMSSDSHYQGKAKAALNQARKQLGGEHHQVVSKAMASGHDVPASVLAGHERRKKLVEQHKKRQAEQEKAAHAQAKADAGAKPKKSSEPAASPAVSEPQPAASQHKATLANGQQVAFVLHPKADPETSTVLMVDPQSLDASWQKQGPEQHIPQGGGGAEMAGKRDNFKAFLGKNQPVEASYVSLDGNGDVDFLDGRHRFSVLRDAGADKVGITVKKDQAEAIKAKLEAKPGDAPAKQAAGSQPAANQTAAVSKDGKLVGAFKSWLGSGDLARLQPRSFAAALQGMASDPEEYGLDAKEGQRLQAALQGIQFGMNSGKVAGAVQDWYANLGPQQRLETLQQVLNAGGEQGNVDSYGKAFAAIAQQQLQGSQQPQQEQPKDKRKSRDDQGEREERIRRMVQAVEAGQKLEDDPVWKAEAEKRKAAAELERKELGRIEYKKAPDKGRWVTIGGTKGEGGRKGGSRVFIADGKIMIGHSSLLGRSLNKIDQPATKKDHTAAQAYLKKHDAKQQNKAEKQQRASNVEKLTSEAAEAGIEPAHLQSLAEEILSHDAAAVAEKKRVLADARSLGKAYGVDLRRKGDDKLVGGHEDEIPHLDEIAATLAQRYPGYFAGAAYDADEHYGQKGSNDAVGKLHELLQEGDPAPLTEEEAYEQAYEYLSEQTGPASAQDPADEDFDFGANVEDGFTPFASDETPVQYEDGQWITIGGHEEGDEKHKGGFRVFIDGNGTILKGGPEGLCGKKVGETKGYFDEVRQKAQGGQEAKQADTAGAASEQGKADPPKPAVAEKPTWTSQRLEEFARHANADEVAKLAQEVGVTVSKQGWGKANTQQALKDIAAKLGVEVPINGLPANEKEPLVKAKRQLETQLAAVPEGDLANVGGFMVRRDGKDHYRIDGQSVQDSVQGDRWEVAAWMARKGQGRGGRQVQSALDRAKEKPPANVFDAVGMADETKGFAKLPYNAAVVVIDEADPNYGQLGRKAFDEKGRAMVRLENGSVYGGPVEPLEEKYSWRRSTPAQPKTVQGGLFG